MPPEQTRWYAPAFFEIFTVGEQPGLIRSGEGPASQVDHAFADAPPWDILVVPGGFGTRALVKDETFLKRLALASERSAITATVCTGAALLARTGLLDGRPATSNKIARGLGARTGAARSVAAARALGG